MNDELELTMCCFVFFFCEYFSCFDVGMAIFERSGTWMCLFGGVDRERL